MKLSVSIITRNEESNLPGALASCEGFADEIVVLDTGSTDATPEIAAAHPKVTLLREAFVDFGQAKGAALAATTGDWVLVLDADERVSEALGAKVLALRANQQLVGMGGYRVRRENRILGRTMHTMGLERDYPLRLFRREGASYGPEMVHEGVELPSRFPIGQIEEPIEHYTFGSLDQYLRKMDLYTTLEVAQGGVPFSFAHLVWSPPTTFLRLYVAKGGFRDGFAGLLWASLAALTRWMRDVKLWMVSLPPTQPASTTQDGESSVEN